MQDGFERQKRQPLFAMRLTRRRLLPHFGDPSENEESLAERRHSAYAALIATEETYLLRAALRLCRGHREDAQDCVQETLIRGYQAFVAGRFAEGSNLRAWLMRILTNLYINETRRRKWNADLDFDQLVIEQGASLEGLLALEGDRPETALLGKVIDEAIETALNALTDDLRLCTILVDMEDFSYAEAAQILEIPVGTVRSRLWRARQLLHGLLLDYAQERRRITNQ